MSRFQVVETVFRGEYDGNTLYRLFDEVSFGLAGNFVLKVPESRGRYPGDRNIWLPVSDVQDLVAAVNVKSFSAKGNDTANDFDSIQDAIDEVFVAGGGVVYVPPGIYKVDDTLVVPKTVKLVGAGYGAKIKQYADGAPIVKMAGATDAYRCAVKDLSLIFNAAQTDADGNGIQLADTGIMCYESEIENVFIDQAYNGVVCKNLVGGHAWMNVLKNVKAYRSHDDGFNLKNPDLGACTTMTLINCYAMQDHDNVKPTAGGFYLRNLTDSSMIGCAVDDLTLGRALFVMSSSLTTMGLHVENCELVSAEAGNIAMFTISGGNVRMLGTRLENMVVDKPAGEAYTFEVNTNAVLRISGMSEYNSSKVSGDHYAIAPDGDATDVTVEDWPGMFGAIAEWSLPHKVKVVNGDFRTTKVGGKLRTYAAEMPAAGSWTAGDYVANTSPSVAGTSPNEYIVKGWTRITTGSENVLNTDWFEDRAPTGT